MDCTKSQSHSRTIIHIDIDCFYAQVELLKRPDLQNDPVGVKQKNIVVTCNYVARRYGVKKCMLISEALQLCPNLFLFNGEDLYKYRQASNQIHSFLSSFTGTVEKSGFDENYLDISELVRERDLKSEHFERITGHYVGDPSTECPCGCHRRLSIGSQIADEIRAKLRSKLGYTSCCGVSYNKLLAKVSCSAHKPNQQTTLLPNGAVQFLRGLRDVEKIPGVGVKMKQLLGLINVRTVQDLQEVDLASLRKVFKKPETVKNLSLGICDSAVKQTGKPNSIGLEDGFKKISVEGDVKEKFGILLQRLMILVEEDGRVPVTIKVTVRKHDSERRTSSKESKQSPVQSSLFGHPVGILSEESRNKLLNIIMGLFCRIVNTSKPFHVTLLGLAFSKFNENVFARSVASFLLDKRDLSVQSMTNFVSREASQEVTNATTPTCDKSESESEAEPSPKKTKLMDKKNKTCSAGTLTIENLSINGDLELSNGTGIDPTVLKELPQDIQNEIIRDLRMNHAKPSSKHPCKQTLINFYFMTKNMS